MIKRFFIISYLLMVHLVAYPQHKEITIRVGQEQSVALNGYENQLTLPRKGFKIQVLLENVAGVYCYASFSDSIYKIGLQDAIPGFSELPDMVMAEKKFNDEKELLISKEGWSYWFYDSLLDWHRFNKKIVLLDHSRIVATKSIKQIYFVEEGKDVKLKDMKLPLYLFFVAVDETDVTGKPTKELLRRKIKINWTNDD